jgi:hypothetical protein
LHNIALPVRMITLAMLLNANKAVEQVLAPAFAAMVIGMV